MHTKQQSGFTLVELAVVVFLVGLLASVGLSALNAQMASASISATKKKQEIIKDALITYLGKYKRLPCPAIDNSGQESRNSGVAAGNWNCKAVFGIVPYTTLDLPKNTALDGWENFFSYAVAQKWTLTLSTTTPVAGGTTTDVAGNAFNVGILGTFTVNDRSPATNATPTTITSKAAALVVSHGKNGLGAFTSKGTQNVSPANGTDEKANVLNSGTWLEPAAFYQREYTDVDVPTYGAFDDVVLSLNPSDLITPLMKDGSLKSAESQWSDQVIRINNMLVSYMLSPSNASCAPPTSQALFETELISNNIPKSDPWGGTLAYTQMITQLKNDGTPSPGSATKPYTLTTSTTGQIINAPTIVTIYGTYTQIINSRCP